MRSPALLALLLLLLASGCASVRSLDGEPLRLDASERTRVEAQVDKALEKREWAAAWNQAVDLGASRERMEEIALAALAAESGSAGDMLDEIRVRWGGLSEPSASKAHEMAGAESLDGDWERAAEIELLVADDPPRYLRAWEVYGRAPPSSAPALLEMITKARDEYEAEQETGD